MTNKDMFKSSHYNSLEDQIGNIIGYEYNGIYK